MTTELFRKHVEGQVALLNEGKPLEAFDKFFAKDGVMYANGEVFASGAAEARRKQEPFIASAEKIVGNIVDLVVAEDQTICAFRNRTSFVTSDGKTFQIDGVCWQRWLDGKVIEEHCYHGDHMQKMLKLGILTSPDATYD
jgi:hypothetical protein